VTPMNSLSTREKKLLILLAALLAFVFWYKTFFGLLWPEYQRLQRERDEALRLQQELLEQTRAMEEKRQAVREIQDEIDKMRVQLGSRAAFLFHDLSKLAAGKVILADIEARDLGSEGLFQVRTVSVGIEGGYRDLLSYVRELESLPGLRIQELTLREEPEDSSGLAKARLVVQHYDWPGRELSSAGISFQYQPFQPYGPVEAALPETEPPGEEAPVPEDNGSLPEAGTEVQEGPEAARLPPLAPYTFPVR